MLIQIVKQIKNINVNNIYVCGKYGYGASFQIRKNEIIRLYFPLNYTNKYIIGLLINQLYKLEIITEVPFNHSYQCHDCIIDFNLNLINSYNNNIISRSICQLLNMTKKEFKKCLQSKIIENEKQQLLKL